MQALELCTFKPEFQRRLTVKTCNDGQGVSATMGFTAKECMLFIYFHFKGKAKINTADNQKKHSQDL